MNTATDREAQIVAAAAASLFGRFPAEKWQELRQQARLQTIPAGSTLFLGAMGPQPALLTEGLLRVYMTSPEGKQVTISYIKPGGCVGIAALVGGPLPISIQAMAPSTLLVFDAGQVKSMVLSDAEAGWAISAELERIVRELLEHIASNVFGTVRQRIGRHLLSLAEPDDQGRLAVPPLTQQELANAIGTAREMASRTLAELTRAGLVSVTRGAIVITAPERLMDEAGFSSSA